MFLDFDHESLRRRNLALTLVAGLSVSLATLPALAQDQPGRGAPKIQVQANDAFVPNADLPEKLKPKKAGDDSKKDGMAWFMTGRLLQSRNDRLGAYSAYKKALAADPDAAAVYRVLVPLAFELGKSEEAVELSLKAFQLDPDNVELRQQVSLYFLRQNRVPEAVKLLEEALASESLDKRSALYVSINELLANLYRATGDVDKAAESLAVVFSAVKNPERYQLEPRVRRALQSANLERLGEAFLQAERVELAIEAFELAVERGQATKASISFNLALAYKQAEKYELALEKLQAYFDAQLQTKGREAYQLLADLLKEQGESEELMARLEKMADKDKRNATLQFFLAEQYVEGEKYDKAEELFRRTLERSKETAGYIGLVSIFRLKNEPKKLFDALVDAARSGIELKSLQTEVDAIAEDEELLSAVLKLADESDIDSDELGTEGYFLLAKLSLAGERSEEAVSLYRKAIAERPDREKLAVLYEELGGVLFDERDYAQAVEVFTEAADQPVLKSQRPMMLFRLSQAMELNGQTDDAVKAVLEARNVLPQVPLLHYQEAWIYYHAKRWDKAIELFEEVIRKFPGDKETVRRCQFSLSNIYVQQGDIRKGEKVLEDVLAEDPEDPSVNNDLGYLYADQGKNLEKAEKMIRKAIAAEPENDAYQDSMGWVLYKLGRYEEAKPWLEKAASVEGGPDATIWDHLGDCQDKLGEKDAARESWKKALEDAEKAASPDEELIGKIKAKLGKDGDSEK